MFFLLFRTKMQISVDNNALNFETHDSNEYFVCPMESSLWKVKFVYNIWFQIYAYSHLQQQTSSIRYMRPILSYSSPYPSMLTKLPSETSELLRLLFYLSPFQFENNPVLTDRHLKKQFIKMKIPSTLQDKAVNQNHKFCKYVTCFFYRAAFNFEMKVKHAEFSHLLILSSFKTCLFLEVSAFTHLFFL